MRRSRHKLVDLSPALINEPREMTMKRKLYLISRPISSPRSFYFVWDGDRTTYAGMQRDYKQPSASIKKANLLNIPIDRRFAHAYSTMHSENSKIFNKKLQLFLQIV